MGFFQRIAARRACCNNSRVFTRQIRYQQPVYSRPVNCKTISRQVVYHQPIISSQTVIQASSIQEQHKSSITSHQTNNKEVREMVIEGSPSGARVGLSETNTRSGNTHKNQTKNTNSGNTREVKDSFDSRDTISTSGKANAVNGNGSIYHITGDAFFGDNNRSVRAKGRSTVINGNANDNNGAVGFQASNNGMSKKEKKQLRKLLDRNFQASLEAAQTAQKAVDQAKKALKASNSAKQSSDKSLRASNAATDASIATQQAFNTLPETVKDEVRAGLNQINKLLSEARENLAADQSQVNKDHLAEIEKFAENYLKKLEEQAPALAQRIAPLIKLEVPTPVQPTVETGDTDTKVQSQAQPAADTGATDTDVEPQAQPDSNKTTSIVDATWMRLIA